MTGRVAHAACAGDCDGNGEVTIDEIIGMVGISLGSPLSSCAAGDINQDGAVTIEEIVAAVGSALAGCQPSTRGTLVVPASEPVGIIRELNGTTVGGTPHMPDQYSVPEPAEVRVDNYLTHLEVPWAMAFAPDGRLLLTERPGRVRQSVNGVLDPTPWATPPVVSVNEGGLLGLALHPDFANQPWVYVCYTFNAAAGLRNRISRIREVDGRGGDEEILLDAFPGAEVHDGCRLKFGPDGKLYATTGDAAQRSQAQDLSSLAGKVLRLNPDGSIPADNPFAGSPVYSYGHRNPQGLAFQPGTSVLFETEHGPSGEIDIGAYDEVNLIAPGANYGWPRAIGAPLLAMYRDPLLTFPDASIPPSGATFYSGNAIASWHGNFLFATLRSQHLQRVVLDNANHVVAIERLFDGVYGRLRDIIEGPDGALYLATSNRDGRGNPSPDDDRILRISAR